MNAELEMLAQLGRYAAAAHAPARWLEEALGRLADKLVQSERINATTERDALISSCEHLEFLSLASPGASACTDPPSTGCRVLMRQIVNRIEIMNTNGNGHHDEPELTAADQVLLDGYIDKHGKALGTAAFRIHLEERAAEQARQAVDAIELERERTDADALHVALAQELRPFTEAVETAQRELTLACQRCDAKQAEHQARMRKAHDRVLAIRQRMGHIGIGTPGRLEKWREHKPGDAPIAPQWTGDAH